MEGEFVSMETQGVPAGQDSPGEPPSRRWSHSAFFGFGVGCVAYLLVLGLFGYMTLFVPGPPDDTLGAGIWLSDMSALLLSAGILAVAYRSADRHPSRAAGLNLSVLFGVVLFMVTTGVASQMQDRLLQRVSL